ncbi:hypothetical protein ACT4R9_05030 [Ornithobacterium rhinotracheale]|uniref:hypothetical protein n=1 Tax=Ornithobacterium rhinotracheale TaxID=28251 RepID=UPI003FA49940
MEKITISIYKYEELETEVQEKVLREYRHKEVNTTSWWQDTYFDFMKICSKLEIDINPFEIFFSGFYSQGDGSSFACNILDISNFIQAVREEKWKDYAPNQAFDFDRLDMDKRVLELIKRGYIDLSFKTYNKHRYYYLHFDWEYTFRNNDKEYPHIAYQIEKLLKWIESVLDDLNQYLYKELQKEYERLTADEYIIQMFAEEDYQFTDKGYSIAKVIN